MNLSESDRIVNAYAERAYGPGWSNYPIWVVVYNNNNGEYRLECINPKDESMEPAFTNSMWALYDVSEAAHKSMVDAVKHMIHEKKRKEKYKHAMP